MKHEIISVNLDVSLLVDSSASKYTSVKLVGTANYAFTLFHFYWVCIKAVEI